MAAGDSATTDYVLLGADDATVLREAAATLAAAGVAVETHELGLRLSARGGAWQRAVATLARLAAPAQLAVRVATIRVGADAIAFQRALLMSRPLASLIPTGAAAAPGADPPARPQHLLSDVFKGESLE